MPFTTETELDITRGYSEKPVPIPGYAVLLTTYLLCVVGASAELKRRGLRIPGRIPLQDVLLLGMATHKLSRLIALDEVTGSLRAPFTHLERKTGEAEVDESPRGRGFRRLIGQLITCPYCLAVWIATSLSFTYSFAPRVARFIGALFSMVGVSDFLNRAYYATKKLE